MAKDLTGLQKALYEVPTECIIYHSKRSEYSKWLRSRALFPLANLFSNVEYDDFEDAEQVREFLIEAIKMYRIFRSRGVISKFDKNTYDEYSGISRIGDGSLGGKGRGLAFIDSFLKRNKLFNKYEGIQISIPRTVVLGMDVFDEFMEANRLDRICCKEL
ncbi:MAG: hypothetical protein U5K51_06770 [Flavobacteriaceae bacterium]|nr:hypothetical protein [Flavobacteriaceae bacterium]